MSLKGRVSVVLLAGLSVLLASVVCRAQNVVLPTGVKAVWDMSEAYREGTATRESICINGLWQWQPGTFNADAVPTDKWGYYKVPGPWPGVQYYLRKNSQNCYAHPAWKGQENTCTSAWYQREIVIPDKWAGRRITVSTEYLNSHAVIFVDGRKAGELWYPSGELDITTMARPGQKQVLSMLVTGLTLEELRKLRNEQIAPAADRKRKIDMFCGLCGDVFLQSTPAGARMQDVMVDTSVRKGEIACHVALDGLQDGTQYHLAVKVLEDGKVVKEFSSPVFTSADLKSGRYTFSQSWKPSKLWNVDTPENMCVLAIDLLDGQGNTVDVIGSIRFGYREFWIDGRDFMLNGSPISCLIIPLDNALWGASGANYQAARESFLRWKAAGVNAMFCHNYGVTPGDTVSYDEVLQAADDVGMLIAFSQPHFKEYDWNAAAADEKNGYARDAAFCVSVARNHPSVVWYATSHNTLGNFLFNAPDVAGGVQDLAPDRNRQRNVESALRAESIIRGLDPSRLVYHQSGGDTGVVWGQNFYLNFAPIQERCDWFEQWATRGVKPLFISEWGAPYGINWTMFRGFWGRTRSWGNDRGAWEFCAAEWNAQFLGDRAFDINDAEKTNLRFEAGKCREGQTWFRWDYPFSPVGTPDLPHRQEVWAMHIQNEWRAFRTWGVSAFNNFSIHSFWIPKNGPSVGRKDLTVDWEHLQRPGLSPDYVEWKSSRMDMELDRNDWIPTEAGKALIANSKPLLAYIAGKPDAFTSKDHNVLAGQTVSKQIIVINNSRAAVNCQVAWSLKLPAPVNGTKVISVESGRQVRVPVEIKLPADLAPGKYDLTLTAKFSTGEEQADTLDIHVLAAQPAVKPAKVALYDPAGETTVLLKTLGIQADTVDAGADLAGYDVLLVGRKALTVDGPAPNIERVRSGLRVILFEQTADVLEQRFGFRVVEYGLRNAFPRVPDHPVLTGLQLDNLRDWNGQATLIPARLEGSARSGHHGVGITRNGVKLDRVYRCGCRGSVASVLIEKPARGNFLPIVDGGYSLQYSPLMEYQEGAGLVLLCQMDVTGRTETDPAASRLVANLLNYASAYKPAPVRTLVLAGDETAADHLKRCGMTLETFKGDLKKDDVLLVAPTGGDVLAPHKETVGKWLAGGGHVVVVGLDAAQANAFLPFAVEMKNEEYINALFGPAGVSSPLAGIGPADVYNRDPRTIPLVSGGVDVLGGGVLGVSKDGGVVLFQLVPWQYDYSKQFNLKRTFRRSSCTLTRILAGMGVGADTPLIARFARGSGDDKQPWLTSFYLDEPVEMDDPYRFFRW